MLLKADRIALNTIQNRVNMSETSIWLLESPVTMVEGETIAYSVDWLGADEVKNISVTVYRNGRDITELLMISKDSQVVDVGVLTMKKITALARDGGCRYIAVINADVDGIPEIRKLEIQVVKDAKNT